MDIPQPLITEWMATVLGRDLTVEESKVLNLVTAKGMAKLNSNLCRGVDPEVTMAVFQIAYGQLKQRRERIVAQTPAEVQSLARQLDRIVTTDELVFLTDCHHGHILSSLVDPSSQMLSENFDLENSAEAYMFASLRAETESLRLKLAQVYHLHIQQQHAAAPLPTLVSMCALVPTEGVSTAMSMVGSASAMMMRCARPVAFSSESNGLSGKPMLKVGLSPFATWFDESQTKPLRVSCGAFCAPLVAIGQTPKAPYVVRFTADTKFHSTHTKLKKVSKRSWIQGPTVETVPPSPTQHDQQHPEAQPVATACLSPSPSVSLSAPCLPPATPGGTLVAFIAKLARRIANNGTPTTRTGTY